MPLTIDALNADTKARELLSSVSGFTLESDGGPLGSFSVDGIESPRRIGSDDAGGAFVLLPSLRVLYVSSEGRAGIIATDFEAFIQLIIACPYWHDILRYSAGGDLDEMRRVAAALEVEMADDEEISELRVALKSTFGLDDTIDPVAALHSAVLASDAIVRGPDGSRYTTLFDRFTIEDNPFLFPFP